MKFKRSTNKILLVKPPDRFLEDAQNPGMVFPDQNSILKHSINIIELSCIDSKSIRNSNFTVVIDAVKMNFLLKLSLFLNGFSIYFHEKKAKVIVKIIKNK